MTLESRASRPDIYTMRCTPLIIPLLAIACGLSACDRRESLTVWETKVRYAETITSGVAVGTAWTITADSFDRTEGVLLAVRFDDGYGKYDQDETYDQRESALEELAQVTLQCHYLITIYFYESGTS